MRSKENLVAGLLPNSLHEFNSGLCIQKLSFQGLRNITELHLPEWKNSIFPLLKCIKNPLLAKPLTEISPSKAILENKLAKLMQEEHKPPEWKVFR